MSETASDVHGPWEGMTIAEGRYEGLTTIGVGGMGYVYRAVDRNLKTNVVIKSPRPALIDGPELADRFEQEVGALVKLSFPHIVPVIDIGRHDGVSYAVMRYLPGGNLVTRARSGGEGHRAPMPWQSMRQWLPSIAKALDFVHRSNFVHRDVKPQNILFDEHGQAYLSDFGIIKAVGVMATGKTRFRTGDGFVGTVDYMAPEVLTAQPFDGRADQYSLAVTVYEYLCGRLPFAGDAIAVVIDKHLNETPRPLSKCVPDVPHWISDAVARALAKCPEDRFPDCNEFARTILGSMPGEPGAELRPTVSSAAAARAAGTADAPPTPSLEAPRAAGRPAAPARPKRKSGSLVFIAIFVVVGGLLGTAAGLAILDNMNASQATAESETGLAANPLPRMISEWKEHSNEVEGGFMFDSAPILKRLEYGGAADLERLLEAEAVGAGRGSARKLDALESDLTSMAETHRTRSLRIKELRDQPPLGDGRPAVSPAALAAEERELHEQGTELVSLAHRLKDLREERQSPRKAYDPGAIAELTTLNEMEAVAVSREPRSVSGECVARAKILTAAPHAALAWTALNVLARSTDPGAPKLVMKRINSLPPERQAALAWSLLLSGQPASIDYAVRIVTDWPDAYGHLSRGAVIELLERDPPTYGAVVPLLLADCRDADERMRIFVAQSKTMRDAWSAELEESCRSGLLRDRADKVVREIVLERRTTAYPLAERIVKEFPATATKGFRGDELAPLLDEAPGLARALAAPWALRGDPALRKAALEAYCREKSPLDVRALADSFARERLSDPEGLVNYLLTQDNAAAAVLAEAAVANIPNINADAIVFTSASPRLVGSDVSRSALLNLAWRSSDKGKRWAMEQLLGADFLKRFRDADTGRDQQLKTMGDISPVLNGKLVALPNTPTTGVRDRGLSVTLRELLTLPSEIDPKPCSPEGEAQIRLTALREELEQTKQKAGPQFVEAFNGLDKYLADLQSLAQTCYGLSQIYELTVVKQLPGAKREMRVNPIITWEFRFPSVLMAQFEREHAQYRDLLKSLPKSRAALILP